MNTPAAAAPAAETLPAERTGRRVPTGATAYDTIVDFLYDEAALLDGQRYHDWYKLLAEDLSYTAPVRITRAGPMRARSVVRTTQHYDEDYGSIGMRIARLDTKSAWAEDPPSRTRRLVSNVRVWEAAKSGEFEVESYLLLLRNRYEYPDLISLSAVRHDVLRSVAGGLKLARREILIDLAVIGMANLAVFL